MKFIADLHLHSKYSRATAKNLNFENLYHAAQLKGVTVVGTGDFTHPAWIAEIESKLEPAEPGLFCLKEEFAKAVDQTVPQSCRRPVRFILQSEISNIYKKNGRVRKNHNLVYFPDIESVKKFNAALDAIGNIKSDGRPILGLDARKLLALMLDINEQGMFIPAHIWTPWFSLFGSKSGFDSMAECFGDLTDRIFAVETGLSSDPPMNWRIAELDHIRLVSSSDAHSPGYLGRNASVFNTALSFSHIRKALATNDLDAYQGTLDMFPHQGKYHYDGHRKCGVCLNPATTVQIGGICPECQKPVTRGVLYRVQELASRPEGYIPENRHGYKNIIPLPDILSEIFEVGPKTKKVTGYYHKAVDMLGPELNILLDLTHTQIESARIPLLADAIMKMRRGDIRIDPGYDGEYGVVNIFSKDEKGALKGEKRLLFDLPPKKADRKTEREVTRPAEPVFSRKKTADTPHQKEPGKDDLLEDLNPEQRTVVESAAKAVIVQAGPGTGKTRTLTAKIAWLVSRKKIDPAGILALTFTNKAARELEKRIEQYLPENKKRPDSTGKVLSATFHSFCLTLLKTYQTDFNASLLDDDARRVLIRDAMGDKAKKADLNRADLFISTCKQNLLLPDDPLDGVAGGDGSLSLQAAYQTYQRLCVRQNVIDFEDLILMSVLLLRRDTAVYRTVLRAYPYLFIDEYQDLNHGQYVLTKLLAQDNHILVIGDPDQSIYGFRGSDNKYFRQFETDFPGCERIFLNRNYRSTQTILDASFQMISKSGETDEKSMVFSDIRGARQLLIRQTASEKSEVVAIGKMIEKFVGGMSFFSVDAGKAGMDEQKEYSFADFAVLYRTSRQCEVFADIFEKEGIPYQTADRKRLFDIDGIRQLISLGRLMTGGGTFHDIKVVFVYFGIKPGGNAFVLLQQFYNDRCGSAADLLQSFVLPDAGGVRAGTREKIHRTLDRLKALLGQAAAWDDAAGIFQFLAEETGLKAVIEASETGKQAFETLINQARIFPAMPELLDELALKKDADNLVDGVEKVSLMTMHAAKGLEFPVVFVAGCEQGLVPFARDGDVIDNPEEERRLFYVAMTRAMDILCLTYARKRRIYGRQEKRQRSFFIEDIEKRLMRLEKSAARVKDSKKEKQLELF